MLNRTRHTRGELCTQTGMHHCRADRWTRLRFYTAPISKSLRGRTFRICVRIRYGILRCSCMWTAWLKRIDPYRNVCRFSVTCIPIGAWFDLLGIAVSHWPLALRTPFSFFSSAENVMLSSTFVCLFVSRIMQKLPSRFLPRYAMRKRGLCCRPVSVRLSVTLVDCIQTAEDIVICQTSCSAW